MDEIKIGDLVMVVRPRGCCGALDAVGMTFIVAAIRHHDGFCIVCGATVNGICAFLSDGGKGDITRLKRIDPPAKGDSLPTREELTA